MLEEQVEFCKTIKGALLDDYLAKGWYRQSFLIFTTHFLAPFSDGHTFRVYWLRYIVPKVLLSKKATAILKANNGFSVHCEPLRLTAEIARLHQLYAAGVSFNTSNNLAELLSDPYNEIYDSHIIQVRDKGRLIACGIFDKGKESIAGIINFYDPAYKKYSPGKFLILQKYKYCIDNAIPYYYPGYYTPEHPLFDYKLFLDKNATEVYLPESRDWVALNDFHY